MPISITKADVIAVAGELSAGLTDDQWALVLLMTGEEVNVGAYPSQAKADIAARYLAAHKAVKMKEAAAVGAGSQYGIGTLASISAGAVSKSFAPTMLSLTASANERELHTTQYGVEYLRLLRLWVFHMRVL